MASHSVLTEMLMEMGFDDKKIVKTLKRLGDKATIESAIEALELSQNSDDLSDGEDNAGAADDKPKGDDNGAATDSQTGDPIETEKERELKRQLYEEKIKQRRIEREEKEKEEELKREIKRREEGKGMGKMKEELEQMQRMKVAEDMRREKASDKAAKDAILRQIAADREEHRRRNSGQSAPAAVTPTSIPAPVSVTTADGKCRLAIRLLDGRQLVNEFDSRESLSAVRVYVITQCSVDGDISFVMPPLPAFSEEDMQKPLNVLGLCPSARVHVIKR
ncbi:unnamed protein product [Oppiella nova]|uniref:UBX domain-containing protein 1 n=1 Tax=Oppiella nova TaxID=334625 RepID=A0A7R9LEE0_9ACAR|nr:unnamed protein product [Oppiella nova]CAG2162813.1 unnamed protein product [Oppiella nova]